MTVAPLEFVQAPPLTPPAFGILSAAVVVDDSDPHAGFGFEYQPAYCGPAQLTVGMCMATQQKTSVNGRGLVEGDPFVVYALNDCKTVGNTDAQARAQAALQAGEGRAVEQWLGEKLAAEATSLGAAASTAEGLAILEQYIHCNYPGVGTIHVSRGIASLLTQGNDLTVSGSHLTTRLGNYVSAGCYDPTAQGVAPKVMWATGTVTLRRGSITGPESPVLDPVTNDLYALAERAYAGAWECFAVAVDVTVP